MKNLFEIKLVKDKMMTIVSMEYWSKIESIQLPVRYMYQLLNRV